VSQGPNPIAPKRQERGVKEKEEEYVPPPEDNTSGLVIGLTVLFLFLGLVLVIVVGFRFFLPDLPTTQLDYGPNHFKLDKEGSWRFDWQRGDTVYSVPLRYNPLKVENVSIVGSLNESFNRPEMYITFDARQGNFSTLALATTELSLNMVRALQVKPIAACTNNQSDACEDRPIVQCTDTNTSVILIKDEGEAKIWLKGDCIVLFGKDLELLRAVDRLLYQWYGVMS